MNQLEQFGHKIYYLLVENFPQTFFVGGMVRDVLLGREVVDVDIATAAKPTQVVKVLKQNQVNIDDAFIKFGVMVAREGSLSVEIASLRKEVYRHSRYPKIQYVTSPKIDAVRRDFTINALYLQPKTAKILDFFGGQADLKNRLIKFIGDPNKKIEQDPLRIIRALRFCIMLDFKLEHNAKLAIKNNFSLIDSLTKTKTEKEIFKLKNKSQREILKKVINSPKALDKYFK